MITVIIPSMYDDLPTDKLIGQLRAFILNSSPTPEVCIYQQLDESVLCTTLEPAWLGDSRGYQSRDRLPDMVTEHNSIKPLTTIIVSLQANNN